jgi:hypothetical protein
MVTRHQLQRLSERIEAITIMVQPPQYLWQDEDETEEEVVARADPSRPIVIISWLPAGATDQW